MTSFKLVKYTPRIKKKRLRKLARKVRTDRLLKFERVFKAQKHIHMSVFKAQRVLDDIRWRYYEEAIMILNLMPYRARERERSIGTGSLSMESHPSSIHNELVWYIHTITKEQ